tara:strand:- start:1387 stop:2187 length:801 start_codon:yes stop_codon:yes gene_type:complete
MKLYANGCSYTAGHGEVHDNNGNLVPPQTFTWPYQMGIENVINNSRRGGSNDRILRTTMKYFNENSADDYVAIIQWTSPVRFERFFPLFNCWTEYCNTSAMEVNRTLKETKNNMGYSLHVDDETVQRKFFKDSIEHDNYNLQETATKVLMYAKEINDYLIDFYKTVIIMQQFLESKNIPYLFTSMSFFNHLKKDKIYNGIDKFEIDTTPYERNLYETLNQSAWNNEPISSLAKDNVVSETNLHPNEEGHKIIAGSLVSTLKERSLM